MLTHEVPGAVLAARDDLEPLLLLAVDGKRRQGSGSGFPSKEAASAALARLRQEVGERVYVGRSDQTLAEYLAKWWEAGDWKGNTRRDYRVQVFRHIVPRVGQVRLQKLSQPDVKGSLSVIAVWREYPHWTGVWATRVSTLCTSWRWLRGCDAGSCWDCGARYRLANRQVRARQQWTKDGDAGRRFISLKTGSKAWRTIDLDDLTVAVLDGHLANQEFERRGRGESYRTDLDLVFCKPEVGRTAISSWRASS